jgi:hypothetical protein
MKSAGLYKQLAKSKFLKSNGIIRPVGGFSSRTPWCPRCQKPIPYVAIEDRGPDPDYPHWFEIRAKCHGKEDYCRVECPTGMKPEMWSTVIATGNFFSETSHEDAGWSGAGGNGK